MPVHSITVPDYGDYGASAFNSPITLSPPLNSRLGIAGLQLRLQITDYGDVVDGARLRPLMCQGGVVETTNEGAIHHDEVCHGNDHPHNWS